MSAVALVAASPARAQPANGDATIVVTASRVAQDPREIGSAVSVLDRDDLRANQTNFVLQALLDVPGVYLNTDRPGDGNISSLSIRGSSNDEVLWLVDGIKLGDPSSTSTQFSPDHLTSNDIQRLEVLRGNQSSLYGSEAIGGVINIITRRAFRDGLEANAEAEAGAYGQLNGGASLLGKSGALDFRLTATGYRQTGPSSEDPRQYNPPIGNDAAEQDEYWRYGFSGRLGYAISPNFTLMATGFWQDSRTDYDGSSYSPDFSVAYPADSADYVRKREYAAGAQAAYATDDGKWKANLTASRYNARRLYFGPFASTPGGELYDGTRDEVTGNVAYGGRGPVRANVGFNYEWERDDQNAYGSPLRAKVHTGSVYGELALLPLTGLTLTGAVRHDDNSQFGGFDTWRVTGAYAFGRAKLRASYGTGAKAPGLYQLFDPIYGNADLRAETSRGGDLGIDLAFGDRFTAQLTYFFNRKRNEIGFDSIPDCATANGCYVQFGRSKAQGIEAGFSFRPTSWISVTQSISYVDAKQDSSTTGDGAYVDLGFPSYVGTTALTVKPVERASLTARLRYRDGNRAGFYGPTRGYAVVDLLGSYALSDRFELYGRVVNLFDKDYQVTSGFRTLGLSAYGGVRVTF